MISAALTSFLTGITEPIEFAFLFVAPVLYVAHAALAASTQFVANTLGMHMGFTFSQGGIDFLVFNAFGKFAQKWWLVLILGPSMRSSITPSSVSPSAGSTSRPPAARTPPWLPRRGLRRRGRRPRT